jgi:hypothetical protein
MDFSLTEEQLALKASARAFAQKELVPLASGIMAIRRPIRWNAACATLGAGASRAERLISKKSTLRAPWSAEGSTSVADG